MDIKKVVAYITAYKDFAALDKCIQAIYKQSYPVSAVFVVDNSPISYLSANNNLLIVNHYPENVGVGQGLAIALKWAFAQEYNFLWAFDQDSIPTQNCLKILIETYERLRQDNYKIGIVAPTAIDSRTCQIVECAIYKKDQFIGCKHNSQLQYYECDAPITSGSLISLAAAQKVSPPRGDLFIDGVDLDYGLRLKQNGFHNLIVPQAILEHQFGSPIQVKLLNKEYFLQKYSALRHYYICRNHTYLDTRYAQGWYRLTSFLRRLKYMMRTIILTLIYDPEDKVIKTWACLLGTYHGLKGKLGKTWY
ncbi:glycosyltransferase family 2 protein [Iningainema tapete]|uniref:Glycosyltransferase family 2 protein n=1 Tax=Iningainema tapete BLCC-T55 TaxID=2748662 RepID=A0A8J6XKL7_9CYAN|nr:glycosyltransferase family 2 protein [Iningainema tapete]MBD2774702.1 glycosyltransferase family 2 protein [Iningainema tapete BLCC-T55]